MFKPLTKLFVVPIGVVLFCSEFAAVAEEADMGRYWAGHKAVLIPKRMATTETNVLNDVLGYWKKNPNVA